MSTTTSFRAPLRREWTAFRTRGRLLVLATAALVTVLLGLLAGYADRGGCADPNGPVACPADPVGPDGRTVSDQMYFAHHALGTHGSLTVRLTGMTGIITYPPPNHDEIVTGVVPWAKVGIMIKDGTRRGSTYAALALTGHHGVHFQYDYAQDVAGRAGGTSGTAPRWLRLTRAGDTITGYESLDGSRWTTVGTATLPHLPATARAGLFATSPGDLTLVRAGLGGSTGQERFTQASGTFDHVTLTGTAAVPTAWTGTALGEHGTTDWERYHRPEGLTATATAYTVTGTGDVGPLGHEPAHPIEETLVGLPIALLILIPLAARFAPRRTRAGTTAGSTPDRRAGTGPAGDRGTPAVVERVGVRGVLARAAVVGSAGFGSGLVAAVVAVPAVVALLRVDGGGVLATPAASYLRVVVGAALLVGLAAVLAFGLAALFRRAWAAVLVGIAALVLPYLVTSVPLLPDTLANWLVGATPAAGFAVLQTRQSYPQVLAHYATSNGYLPLPWWGGLLVLAAWTAAALALAARTHRTGSAAPVGWT
jgi:hypothetical protein